MSKKIKLTDHQKQYINSNAKYWIETLLPNDLNQARAHLQKGNSYCCLGVGALCYEIKTGNELPRDNLGNYDELTLVGDFAAVKEWLGLYKPNGSTDAGLKALSARNDTGETFQSIAELLLDKPEEYFNALKKGSSEKCE